MFLEMFGERCLLEMFGERCLDMRPAHVLCPAEVHLKISLSAFIAGFYPKNRKRSGGPHLKAIRRDGHQRPDLVLGLGVQICCAKDTYSRPLDIFLSKAVGSIFGLRQGIHGNDGEIPAPQMPVLTFF